jgi:glycosyltransferase involved in cell wall biosynthesis
VSIRRVRVVVLVSGTGDRVDDLLRQIAAWPHTHVEPIWTGDPQLRPPGRWADDPRATIGGLPGGVVRAAVDGTRRALVIGLDVVARGTEPALLLDAGSVLAVRPVAIPDDAVGVVARGAPPVDGFTPTVADLAQWGPYSTAILSAPPSTAADLVTRLLDAGDGVAPGLALAASLADHRVHILPGEVLGWPVCPPDGADALQPGHTGPALFDLIHLDRDEPWHLDLGLVAPRVRLSERPELAGRLRPPLLVGDLRAPGGIEIDGAVRTLLADQVRAARRGDAPVPPDPWDQPTEFVAWLESPARTWEPQLGRYWFELWLQRADLRQAFPDPVGADLARFREWADHRHRYEATSSLVRSHRSDPDATWRSGGAASGGVDVVGFFGSEMSLSNVADRVVASLDAVGIPHRTASLRRTGSPAREHAVDGTLAHDTLNHDTLEHDTLDHDTVVVVANHDQIEPLLAEHGDVLAGRRLIGYWHWDVEHVPDEVAARMRLFDQIWVLNEYTERTLASVPGAPTVRSLPLPVSEPQVSPASREELGLPAGRPVVLVTFDHLSVTERKNPLGAIEAFRRAFPEPTDDGPVLLVKTMNADQRWVEHERVRIAAMDRPDVLVVDRLLPKPDQMALVAHADVMLSLHRAEGLGLHLIEAMWLGTPTIATRYSGNLSFMDDANSLLVDAAMISVERGEGFFPPEAFWADPDLDQAASHLRRLIGDAALRRRLAAAGRARMEQQPSFEEIGRTIAAWCGIQVR